jgi:hypothetical protein
MIKNVLADYPILHTKISSYELTSGANPIPVAEKISNIEPIVFIQVQSTEWLTYGI